MRIFLLATLLLSAATARLGQPPQATQEVKWGMVEGAVVDGDGKPLPNAIVTSYIDARGAARNVNQYDTNANGEFRFPCPEGKVWVLAHKDSEGYPYAFFAFYLMPGQEFPTVQVKPGETTRGVVVRVGVKAAHLNYEVIDEEGKPVGGGFNFIRLDQDVPYSQGAVAKDDLLVPPTPFRATFEAKGFKPWHYGGDKWRGEEGVISLKSGEVLNLTIRLQRER